jgi:hypothetical protein
MTIELEEKLVNKYPEICEKYNEDKDKNCFNQYGFEFGDGWFDLIDEALGKLDDVRKNTGLEFKIGQAKSKFDELRLYIDFLPGQRGAKIQQAISQVNEIVSEAEKKSKTITENE